MKFPTDIIVDYCGTLVVADADNNRVVDMNKNLQAKFRESIEKEGRLLYEKI